MKRVSLVFLFTTFAVICSAQPGVIHKKDVKFSLKEYEIIDSTFKGEFSKLVNYLDAEYNHRVDKDGNRFDFNHLNTYICQKGSDYVIYMRYSFNMDYLERQSGYTIIDGKLVLFRVACPNPHWFRSIKESKSFSYVFYYYLWPLPNGKYMESSIWDDEYPLVAKVYLYDGKSFSPCPEELINWWCWHGDSYRKYYNVLAND